MTTTRHHRVKPATLRRSHAELPGAACRPGRAIVFLLAGCCCFALAAAAQNKPRTPEQIRQQIEKLEQQREKLEQEAEEAERREGRRREFKELQDETRERLRDIQAELKEMAGNDEESPTRRKQIAEMHNYFAVVQKLCRQILALKDASDFDKALQLARRRELLDTKWQMVVEPRFRFAAEIEDMEHFAREEGGPRHLEVINKLKALHEEDAPARDREFKLWQERQKREIEMHRLMEEFWHPPAPAER